MSTKLVTS